MTHEFENVLDCLRSGSLAVSKPVTDLLLESVDALRAMLSEAQADRKRSDFEMLLRKVRRATR